MARPVGANAEETRRKILKSASHLYASFGFEGTSVRQIARGADVSLGMIRHYFGSKEGLYRACMATAYGVYAELGQQIKIGVSSGGAPDKVVGEATRAGFRFAVDNRAACKLVLWDLMEQETWRHEHGDREMLPFIREAAKVLAEVLNQDVGQTALRIRSLIFLVARYATADHDEIAALVTGDTTAKADDATRGAIEEHLADLGARLFA
jgi:AcrR family transcriptional regulator